MSGLEKVDLEGGPMTVESFFVLYKEQRQWDREKVVGVEMNA